MDGLSARSLDVRGGALRYRYYAGTPASTDAPTLLFLHGLPSYSNDWDRQVHFLRPKGYGFLIPDLLGAGETSRPLEASAYKLNDMAADIIELLDAEKLDKVIGVGHDWGSVLLSRLSMLHPNRFMAFAWIGLSFMEPVTFKFDLEATMVAMKDLLGYEGYAYWQFFSREDAPEVIERNVDSFIQLLYPNDPDLWRTWMVLPGKTSEWMDANMQPAWPRYLKDKEIAGIRENILTRGGIRSSLGWYLSQLENHDLQDNLSIPRERWTIRSPSLFVVAMRDCLCTEKRGKLSMNEFGTDVTTVELHTGHWPHLEATDEVNQALDKWASSLLSRKQV